ncbi:hypothetical protein [Idiomarina xiamenensis]|uniref:Uncharacterized protein n=1 Tax=Idiomarina xiamenensis 10-D-4 TaxID=740709 RepID=K2K8W1_9GAMM|nr:hypothetical protein [Idiomarina xiamenensis]EKE79444.1 hypothetical protein A10D4_12789 [Idiomarina xiamenensis 10-D-4]
MTDSIDRAQQTAMHLEQINIENARHKTPVATATGECLCCGNPDIEPGRRWCDKYCAAEWEQRKKVGISL